MAALRFGIVGAGHRTTTVLLPAARLVDNTSLAAVCDTSESALDHISSSYGINGYRDFGAMLERERLDFLIAATPHDAYKGIIELAAERGIHVLKEKPFAVSLEEGTYFRDLAEGRIHIGTLLQRRTIPTYSHFFRLRQQLGEPFFIESKYAKFIEKPYDGWRGDREKVGGGVIIDMGYHMMDLLIWYFGLPSKAYSTYTSRAAPGVLYRAEDTANILFSYGEGLNGSLFVSKYYSPKTDYMKIIGSEGIIVLDGSGASVFRPDGEQVGSLHNLISEVDAVKAQIAAFCSVVRGENSEYSTPHYNLQHLAFVEACYRSQEFDQVVNPFELLKRS